jgi:hypothetical protein
MRYKLRITYEVNIAKWRIDDPHDIKNAEWGLAVYDRNLGKWVHTNDLDRPGENVIIKKVEVLEE